MIFLLWHRLAQAVFDNLALIFAIGIAIGLSVDGSGASRSCRCNWLSSYEKQY
ncbi:hypothetical protein ACT7DN_18075 [Bacillus paranthracis]